MNEHQSAGQSSGPLSNFDLFHQVWSNAVDSPRYSKDEWMVLEQRLRKIAFLPESY